MEREITIGDKYGPAMAITEQEAADAYFEECVQHTLSFGEVDRAEAERIERVNFGYYAGYYDTETRARVERLFRCAHPIFGSVAQYRPPSAEEAFAARPADSESRP